MPPEDQLIGRIAAALGSSGPSAFANLVVGIGDDAAVISTGSGTQWALSCDCSLEGVHFQADLHPSDSVGYKALARATSDLAAMGAKPRFFLLTLALPKSRTGEWLDQFLVGLRRAARQFGMRLIGGDTTRSRAVFVSITVVGENPGRGAIRRSGARPGDRIYVSGGNLGAAQLGLLLLKTGAAIQPRPKQAKGSSRLLSSALQAHLHPQIRVDLGAFLARHQVASAMIDISDGLSSDLARLCAASRVGARVWAQSIPCVELPVGPKTAGHLPGGLNRLQLALDGGEDYELLFTVPPENEKRLRRAPGFAKLTQIGEIVPGRRAILVDTRGREKPVLAAGWDPFRGR